MTNIAVIGSYILFHYDIQKLVKLVKCHVYEIISYAYVVSPIKYRLLRAILYFMVGT